MLTRIFEGRINMDCQYDVVQAVSQLVVRFFCRCVLQGYDHLTIFCSSELVCPNKSQTQAYK